MKKPFSSMLLAAVAAGALTLTSPHAALADTNLWDMTKAKAGADGKVRIEGTGGRILRLDDPASSIVDDPLAPGGKALAFTGAQVQSPNVGKILEPADGGSVHLKLKIKPDAEAGDAEQTVLMHPGVYELRYHPRRKDLSLYLSQTTGEKKFVFARAPLPPGQWSSVEAIVQGNEFKLIVNDKADAKTFEAGQSLQRTRAYLQIGMIKDRPYKGAIADLFIAEPIQ